MTHPREAEFGRISDWLHREAAAKSLEEIRDYARAKFDLLYALVRSFPPHLVHSRAPGEEWAPVDALKHVVEWNWQVGEDILHVALTGERPGNPLPDFEPDVEQLIARQEESLDSIYAHVSAADPGGFLDITWEHPFFGQLNWREWYLFLGVHAIDHTGQINEMKQALNA